MLPLKRTYLLLGEKSLVPSKGLEPPHRCRYMDLNHARLPIPPRWQSGLAMQRRPLKPPCQEDQPFYFTSMSEAVKPPLRLRMLWAKAKKESLKSTLPQFRTHRNLRV